MPYYFPATYQYYQPQNYQPQNYQPQNNQITSSGIIWVGSEIEAQNYPVAPNNAVALWDSTKPAIYLKQADASGRPMMKVYALTERTEAAQMKREEEVSKDTTFALKTDLDPIEAKIEAIKVELKNLRKEMKKREVDDE